MGPWQQLSSLWEPPCFGSRSTQTSQGQYEWRLLLAENIFQPSSELYVLKNKRPPLVWESTGQPALSAPPASSGCSHCTRPETCPGTECERWAWSRWERSRPSCGGGSTFPPAAEWGGAGAWRGWGSGCAGWCSGCRSQRARWRQRLLPGSSPPPRGLLQTPGEQGEKNGELDQLCASRWGRSLRWSLSSGTQTDLRVQLWVCTLEGSSRKCLQHMWVEVNHNRHTQTLEFFLFMESYSYYNDLILKLI